MLDPASIEKLAESPEKNDPLLNVALAEEGNAGVLLALVSCPSLGAQAIDVIADRLTGDVVGLDTGDDATEGIPALELEKKIIGHPNAPAAVRDATLGRHIDEAFFVLAGGAHPNATDRALEALASWRSASPLHDRPWLTLLVAAPSHPSLLARWAGDGELLREAAALLARDLALLEKLSCDPSRRVRRAVASNPNAGQIRSSLADSDTAAEVRARARKLPPSRVEEIGFAACLRAMQEGGALASDVRRALLDAGASLDEEGAFLAARHLDPEGLHSLVAQATGPDQDPLDARGAGIGVGLGLRRSNEIGEAGDGHDAQLSNDIVHLLTRQPNAETRLTGKARVALWIAQSLARSRMVAAGDLHLIAPGALAGDRMVLHRWAASLPAAPRLESLLESATPVPAGVVELSWRNPAVSDDAIVALCRRVAPGVRSDRELPEDELDLAPLSRPLPVLERAVLAAIARVAVSPRGALAAIALEPRRCRYVLSAMPTWKGSLNGARLARVLRSYAGALSAAARPSAGSTPPGGPRPASVARWTDRKLMEMEAAIALAVGDLTIEELTRRLKVGSIRIQDGLALAAAVEARAAIDGPTMFAPILDFAAAHRSKDAAALALWMLLENLDRVRPSSLIGSAIDGLAVAGTVVAPAVCEALATLERRSPGRMETVHAQSPRGRATVASAIARAYRAFGGMRDET
ncbi:MAG TPA: hypothetical protein VK550_00360 [Polyangiaceae bacterium]|nr:hypothetical protein [Polyangiaceae bacterium]